MPSVLSRVGAAVSALRGPRASAQAVSVVPNVGAYQAMAALQTKPENPQRGVGSGLDWIGRYVEGGYEPGADCDVRGETVVTPEQALMVSAVWACIDAISSPLASSDWNIYEGVRGSSKQQALPEDGLQYILNTRPNPEMTAQSAKRALMIAANGWGNGYAEIVRDMAGRVVQLWPIRPDRAELRRDEYTGELFLSVHNDWSGQNVDLAMRDVFQVRGPGISGVLGDNQLARAVKSISMSVALDQFAQSYFQNGTQMGIVLEMPGLGRMDDNAKADLRKNFNREHRGSRNAFRLGLAEGGTKIHQLQVEAQKAQMTEARYQMIEDIARWWRVPLHKIGHLQRSTNNNIEHQGLEFTRDTLRPWKKEIEQECDFKLFPGRVRKFVELDLDWAAEGDFKSRADAIQVLRGCGVYSVNDALRKLGENTIPATKGGDARTMNGASVKLEDVGKNLAPAAAPAAPVTPPDTETDDAPAVPVENAFRRAKARYDGRMAEGGDRKSAAQLAASAAHGYIAAAMDLLGGEFAPGGALRKEAHHELKKVLDGDSPADAAQRLMQANKETA